MFAVSCAALVLALACVWLPVFCLRIGKTVGSTQFFLFVSGMSADIYIYWSLLIIHIDAIALCWFARLNPGSVPTVRLCGWNVCGWVCAEVGLSLIHI